MRSNIIDFQSILLRHAHFGQLVDTLISLMKSMFRWNNPIQAKLVNVNIQIPVIFKFYRISS